MELKGKTILVTGGTGIGVGAGVCSAIAEAGGRLIVNGRNAEKLEATIAKYPGAIAALGDIRDALQVEEMFRTIERECGIVDGLVNNAGIGLSKLAHEVNEKEFDDLYAVDLRASWLVARGFIRQLLAGGRGGSIVNVSSVHAHATMPRYALYAGAKAGIEGITRGLAYEYGAKGIRCNAMAPGYVHAEQNYELIRSWTDDPQGWVHEHTLNHQALQYEITPRDCGDLAVFLLSDRSRCITGQTIRIDGGMTAMLYNRDFLS
jgi:NAD(P)-dependent dehydrogenase (short-subunit alcohol dehydrogenase family)